MRHFIVMLITCLLFLTLTTSEVEPMIKVDSHETKVEYDVKSMKRSPIITPPAPKGNEHPDPPPTSP
ncbi:hypothetical protein IHE45_04G082700 [Dioscorea alata]|uniref:Uncharacterized protein n=1 Tax=Dioscorea alata TaxID=55571 RepID=A0ACB7WE27_DIOAL|nr:hypothetical protein IHE45_04G082700 [Dioscorea alata]